MAIFQAYFDDSGTHTQSEVAVAACVFSDARRWDQFRAKWRKASSDRPDGFGVFHMAEAVDRRGPFTGWTETRFQRVMDRVMEILCECALSVSISAVVKADYDQWVIGRLRSKLGNEHYTFAVQSSLAHVNQWRATQPGFGSGPIQYIFDRMTRGKTEIDSLFSSLIAHGLAPNFGIEPSGWSFHSKADQTPLQAADILAWNGYRYVVRAQLPASRGLPGGKPHRSFLRLIDQVPRTVDLWTRYFDKTILPDFVAETTAFYEAAGWDQTPLGGFY